MSSAGDPQLARRIVEQAHRFELGALLRALALAGYRGTEVVLESAITWAYRGSLVQAVRYEEAPPRAIVTLNVGLLGNQGPLPSYVYRLLEPSGNEPLERLLQFFASRLLADEARALFPEEDPALFPHFAGTRGSLRALLGLASPVGLHWIFSQAYPELETSVHRRVSMRYVPTAGVVLGRSCFGDGSAFGGYAPVPIGSLHVALLCDEPTDGARRPWESEAVRRLQEYVLPTLREHRMHLHVLLVFRDQPSWMQLSTERHLGHQPLFEERLRTAPRQVRSAVLFSGELGG